jgi:hypothetical protein
MDSTHILLVKLWEGRGYSLLPIGVPIPYLNILVKLRREVITANSTLSSSKMVRMAGKAGFPKTRGANKLVH